MPLPYFQKPNHDWQHTERARRFTERGRDKRRVAHADPLRFILMSVLVLGFLGLAGMLGVFAYMSRDLPDPNQLSERVVPLSTKIYDRTGEVLLYEIHGNQQRTLIKLQDLPDYVKWAAIITEDKNFYAHPGIDLKGTLRAIIVNVLRGERAQGGSTITQQLIKNSLLTTEKKYSRKIKEWVLAYRLEQKFSKDEILQLYFNEIPYGSTAYGIEAASQTYFGKSVCNLTIAEAATIAAMTQAPTYYSPYGSHKDELLNRRRYVIDQLVESGHITKDEGDGARAEEPVFKERSQNITAPHFVMYVQELLTKTYGEKLVEQGGLKVTTTLDAGLQKIAEDTITEKIPDLEERWNATNAALVALDPKTQQILAMVGSRDFFDETIDGQVNVALRPRQPGSSFKPIAYAAGFIKGYTPDTALFDVQTIFKTDTEDYEPHNYDSKEHGLVTVREALQQSLNIPAVKMLYLTGIDNVLQLAEKLGYTTFVDRSRFGLSLVLGGGEVKLLEHTSAFAIFADEGVRAHATTPILQVTDKDGRVLETYKEQPEELLDKEIARTITAILSDNAARTPTFGEHNLLTLPDRSVAAKTGTTNDYRDAWLIGYTPSLAAGVWAGNNDFSEMKRGGGGSSVTGPIWNAFMRDALKETPPESFTKPKPMKSDKPILSGKAQVTIKVDRISGKPATEFTPDYLIEEHTFIEPHSILHYVNKDDPQGPAPTDPSLDPQYAGWEAGVVAWFAKNKTEYTNLTPLPTNLPDEGIAPTVAFDGLADNARVTTTPLQVSVKLYAPLGIDRVEYFLNETRIGINHLWPFNLTAMVVGMPSGYYTLRAVTYDTAENIGYAEKTVSLIIPSNNPVLSWSYPENNAVLRTKDFPLYLQLTLGYPETVYELAITARSDASEKFTIQDFTGNTFQPSAKALWETTPDIGTYTLTATAFNLYGGKLGEESLTIRVAE